MTAYENCPHCAGRRHRNTDTGETTCLSCDKIKEHQARMVVMEKRIRDAYAVKVVQVSYSTFLGYEVRKLDGQPWQFRELGSINGWRKAFSETDARKRIMAMHPPDPKQMGDDSPLLEKCRLCGDPANGTTHFCRNCAQSKFGDAADPRRW